MVKLQFLFIVLILSFNSFAQLEITGHVKKTGSGKPISGARVKSIGANNYAVTDSMGYFQLNATIGDSLLIEASDRESQVISVSSGNRDIYLQPTIPTYSIVEEPADFNGGLNMFNSYVHSKLKRVKGYRTHRRVFVYFVIDTAGLVMQEETAIIGSPNEQEVLKTDKQFNKELIRVVNESPPWIPARQRGKKVRYGMSLPFTF